MRLECVTAVRVSSCSIVCLNDSYERVIDVRTYHALCYITEVYVRISVA